MKTIFLLLMVVSVGCTSAPHDHQKDESHRSGDPVVDKIFR